MAPPSSFRQDYRLDKTLLNPKGSGARRHYWIILGVTIVIIVAGMEIFNTPPASAKINPDQTVAMKTIVIADLEQQAATRTMASSQQKITTSTADKRLITHTLHEEIIPAALRVDHSAVTTAITPPQDRNITHKIIIKKGDNLATIFNRHKLSAKTLLEILVLHETLQLKRLIPGKKLTLVISPQHQLHELHYTLGKFTTLHVLRQQEDNGKGPFSASINMLSIETRTAYATGIINNSLFVAAQNAGLSDNLTMELANIFGWDIDFALDVRKNDRFSVIYEEIFHNGEKIGEGRILAAEFHNRKNSYRAIQHIDGSGYKRYFDPEGYSLRKTFLRSPVDFTRISSRFNLSRRHPVLNRIRAHKGVDYAASHGTPVRATGDGKVIHRKRKGGYGKTVIIQHGTSYTTLYAHLSRYARKARHGRKVKQGQIIGYVGQTGLATGPHLHYEFRVNGSHRNPLTVRLPQAMPIKPKYKTAFFKSAQPLLTQLDTLNKSHTLLAAIATPQQFE